MEKFIGPHLKFLQICELQLKLLLITDINMLTSDKEAFTNYIEKILDFKDQLPQQSLIRFLGQENNFQMLKDCFLVSLKKQGIEHILIL